MRTVLLAVALGVSMSACGTSLAAAVASPCADATALFSQKQVTIFNCDSAAEAFAEAERKHRGWKAYKAKKISGRTWIVYLRESSSALGLAT